MNDSINKGCLRQLNGVVKMVSLYGNINNKTRNSKVRNCPNLMHLCFELLIFFFAASNREKIIDIEGCNDGAMVSNTIKDAGFTC